MNLVDKTKPSMKSLVEEIYSAGLYKDSDIADMVSFGMFDANDYQDITGKPYGKTSSDSVAPSVSETSKGNSSTGTSTQTKDPATTADKAKTDNSSKTATSESKSTAGSNTTTSETSTANATGSVSGSGSKSNSSNGSTAKDANDSSNVKGNK